MDESLIKAYLTEFGGDFHLFTKLFEGRFQLGTHIHQRLGQAFFNSLSSSDQARLRGSYYDPFYRDRLEEVEECIMWLLEHPA